MNESDSGLEMIAEQMIKAFESKDAKQLAKLLKLAVQLADNDEPSSNESEES